MGSGSLAFFLPPQIRLWRYSCTTPKLKAVPACKIPLPAEKVYLDWDAPPVADWLCPEIRSLIYPPAPPARVKVSGFGKKSTGTGTGAGTDRSEGR